MPALSDESIGISIVFALAENPIGFCLPRGPFFGHFRLCSRLTEDDGFRPGGKHSTPDEDLSGVRACTGVLKGLAVIPRHPRRRMLGLFGAVFLQLGEVVEGIGLIQFAGVDQTHEQIAYLSTVLGLIKQTVPPMENGFLQGPLHNVGI